MMSPTTLYTIGHSDRTLEDLIALLVWAGIRTLVDVRAYPRSRRHPQFSSEFLRAGAEEAGMTCHWAGRQLGGRRPTRIDSPHTALKEDGLRAYADYMDTGPFAQGAAHLVNLAAQSPTTILCAERQPENCHRSLIADYLVLQGISVVHLLDVDDAREHQLSPSVRCESARLVYDRHTTGRLELN